MLPENNNFVDADTHFHDDDRYYEDEQLDQMYAAEQQRLDDAARADDDCRRCEEAAAELSESPSAVIARGNIAAVEKIADLFKRKVS